MTTLILAAPHRFTVEQYYGMAEAGIFTPDARVELLEGQILDMFSVGPLHSGTVARLANLLVLRGGERWIVRSQNPGTFERMLRAATRPRSFAATCRFLHAKPSDAR